jgi:hypothetical protein
VLGSEKKKVSLNGNSAKKIYNDMSITLGDKCHSNSTVKNLYVRLRTGQSTEDKECFGRPTQVTIPENVDAMILGDRRISTKKRAETLAIPKERVGSIIHEILVMRML